MDTQAVKGNGIQSKLLWAAVIALGAVSFAIVALTRGEPLLFKGEDFAKTDINRVDEETS